MLCAQIVYAMPMGYRSEESCGDENGPAAELNGPYGVGGTKTWQQVIDNAKGMLVRFDGLVDKSPEG